MGHEQIRGLNDAEREAVRAYEEAKMSHAAAALDAVWDSQIEEEETETVGHAVRRIEEAHARLEELVQEDTPGRPGAEGYEELLVLLRERRLGERSVRTPQEPTVPWEELPDPRRLLFCCLALEHYFFLTGGALRFAPGGETKNRLYDVPEERRLEMSEEEVAGVHGDRHELLMRLYRLLEAAADDSAEEWRRAMFALGYECGEELLLFFACYESEADYVEGFIEGCLERISEEEDEGFTHPDDVKVSHFRAMWQDPGLPQSRLRDPGRRGRPLAPLKPPSREARAPSPIPSAFLSHENCTKPFLQAYKSKIHISGSTLRVSAVAVKGSIPESSGSSGRSAPRTPH